MNQTKIINAYFILTQLSTTKLPVSTAYALYQLRKRLEPTYNFCVEQERAIAERYEGRFEGSALHFADAEAAKNANDEMKALHAMDVEYDAAPIMVNAKDFNETELSINDVATLDGFVEFV